MTGSSSAPARNVSTMAPVPARKVIHCVLPCRPPVPSMTPMTSWATVPTTISESAVETLNQIAISVATNANPTHNAERAHAFVMEPSSFNCVQGSLPA